jgi:hypothetical protein
MLRNQFHIAISLVSFIIQKGIKLPAAYELSHPEMQAQVGALLHDVQTGESKALEFLTEVSAKNMEVSVCLDWLMTTSVIGTILEHPEMDLKFGLGGEESKPKPSDGIILL